MENTGETSEYREMSHECRACTELADLVERYYEAGGFVEWGGWNIHSINPRGGAGRTFLVKVHSAPTRYREKSGGEEKSFPGGPGTHVLTLDAAGSSWRVVDKTEVEG
jgi:hypothetical protein